MERIVLRATVGILGTVTVSRLAQAQSCAMCGSSFAPNEPITRAFNSSILFLMAAPYALFGTAALSIYILYRRASARRPDVVVPLPERASGSLTGTEPMEV